MPKKRIANKIKVVNLIAIISKDLINFAFNDLSMKDRPLKIDSIGKVYLTEVDKVMRSDKLLNRFSHNINIQIMLWEEVFIWATSTPISCIEVITDFLASDNPDIIRKDRIEHRAVLYFFGLALDLSILWFPLWRSQLQRDHISHCWYSFIGPTCPCIIIFFHIDTLYQTHCVHCFENISFHSIIICGFLISHPIIAGSNITDF